MSQVQIQRWVDRLPVTHSEMVQKADELALRAEIRGEGVSATLALYWLQRAEGMPQPAPQAEEEAEAPAVADTWNGVDLPSERIQDVHLPDDGFEG